MYYPANQNSVPQPADTKKKTTAHALSFAAFLLLLQSFTDVTNTSLSYRESGLGDSWVPPTHNLAGSLDFLSGFAKFGDSDLQTVTGYPLAYHTLDDEEEEARRLAADDDACATMSHQSHEDEFMEIAPIDADHSQHHDHHRHQSSSSSNSAVTPRSRNETAIETLDSMTTEEIVDFLQYVPAHQVNQVRNAHPNLQAAAQWVVPTPFGPGGPSFVRWTSAFEPVAVEPNAPPVPFWWSCANCSNYSDNHQFCTSCNSKIEVTACRVFLGQLRKQASAESVARMIAHLCPGVVPLHIESHNNKGGHEKGCAWVYLHTPADCDALIALHKRVYFDSDLNGYEGFWVADVDQSTHLCNFADERKADPNRSALLPRQPIVAEYPMSSMLRTVAARQRSQAFAEPLGANWAPRGNGWFGAAPVDRQAM